MQEISARINLYTGGVNYKILITPGNQKCNSITVHNKYLTHVAFGNDLNCCECGEGPL